MKLPYGAMFQCLKCGYVFEHRWRGGDVKDQYCSAGTDCKKCGHEYVKNIGSSP